jgi:hypothetical protein
MRSTKTVLVIALAAAGLAGLVQPGSAATAKRHLQCFAVPPIGVGGLFGSVQIQQRAIITNNTSNTIAANTVYTYTMQGHQLSQTSAAALAPGQQFNVPGLTGGNATSCDAWIIVNFGVQTAPAVRQGTFQKMP